MHAKYEQWNVTPSHCVHFELQISPSIIPESTKVFVNGNWVGIHRDPDTLVKTLRDLRRCVDIDAETSVVRDIRTQELRLFTDAGRTCRPLYVVNEAMQTLEIQKEDIMKLKDDDNANFTFQSLLEEG